MPTGAPVTWSMLASSQIALILCGNGNNRKLCQAQKVIANPSFGSQEGFLEEVELLTVKNENICQIREEGECAKLWQQTGARSVLGTDVWRVWWAQG